MHGWSEVCQANCPHGARIQGAAAESLQGDDGWKNAQPGDQALRGNWWEIFGDPQLNSLEEELTASNQDLKVAEARFRQARAMIRFNRSAAFPTISTSPSITNEETVGKPALFSDRWRTTAPGDFTLPIDLSYEVDLWGSVRRTVSASREEAQATAADLQTASLSLHAELAVDYFELRSADAQKQLLDDTVKAYTDALQTNSESIRGRSCSQVGRGTSEDAAGRAQVADTDITVTRAQFEHAIAILIGKPPAEFNMAPSPQTALHLPVIPVGLPTICWNAGPTLPRVSVGSRKPTTR